MNILFIIPARGGSKGVYRKNIAWVGNLPLIAYKIIAARKCKFAKRIIVSTEDEEIAEIALKYGGEVPFIRPSELATDTAGSMDVVMHAVQWIDKHDPVKYDYVCLLEPSSPFLSYQGINDAMDLMIDSGADTMLSVKRAEVNRVFINTLDENKGLSRFYREISKLKSTRRQEQEIEYTLNGCIYAARYHYLKENRIFHSVHSVPYIMPEEYSIEIDRQIDLSYAQYLVDQGLIDVSSWENDKV